MNKQGGLKPPSNRLWRARRRRGLEQKQVAYLLGQPGIDQISRYEQGERLPSLEIALKLELIYGVPVRLLFSELAREIQTDLQRRIEGSQPLRKLFGEAPAKSLSLSEYCAFAERLAMPNASEADKAQVRRHVTGLAKALAGLT